VDDCDLVFFYKKSYLLHWELGIFAENIYKHNRLCVCRGGSDWDTRTGKQIEAIFSMGAAFGHYIDIDGGSDFGNG
jgi:hypothetical protein